MSQRRGRRPRPGRRWSWAGLLGSLLAAGALLGAGAPPEGAAAKAPDLIRSHRVLSVRCVAGPANTVRAQLKVRMRVVNYEGFGGDWADRMEAKARLEPTTAGLNYTRKWVSWKTPNLTINRTHTYLIRLTTDNVSANGAWKVHLKLIWHRPFPTRNISINLYRQFNAGCAGTGVGWAPGGS